MLFGVKRQYPFKLKKGSNWVSVTSNFISFLTNHKNEIRRVFRNTLCGDEIFLQTLLWNSPFRNNLFLSNDKTCGNLREIKWVDHKPYVWKENNYEYLVSCNKLFARKFTSQDKNLLLKIAQHNGCYEDVKTILNNLQ